MKTHTNEFKQEIKKFGRQIDSKITYTLNNEEIELGAEQLNSITPHYQGAILKSVMRQLDVDSNVDIPIGTEINYQFGLKVGNSYEYLDFGNYIVYSSEKQEDLKGYKIICYDKMLYSMVPYEAMEITYPITIRDYISAICTKLGLTFKNTSDEFANYDKEIPNELFLDSNGNSLDYTFRDVLDQLAEVTASTICINEDDDELEIRYLNNAIGEKTTISGTNITIQNCVDGKNVELTQIIGNSNGQNLFDKDTANIIYAYINKSNHRLIKENYQNNKTIIFQCEANTTYTISKTLSSRFRIGFYPSIIQQGLLQNFVDADSETSTTITTDSTNLYMYLYYWTNSDTKTEQEILDSITIQKSPINVVTGIQNINVSNGNDSNIYQIDLDTIELTTNQERIYKDNNEWYLDKENGSSIITTQITDAELISQLESLQLFKGLNNVSVTSENLAGKITINYASKIDTINEEYLKDVNVNFGEKFGKVNSIVLSRSAESDNVYLRDEESVLENGLCEIKIQDNQIMNFNDRSDYLEDILDQLDGLEYYVNNFTSTGVTYYNLCDQYNVQIGNTIYNCIMFNDEIDVTQGLQETIYTELPDESETDYTKADKTDRKINQAWLIVNKQESTIEGLVSKTSILDDGVYTKEQVDNLLINTETGLTNIFSEAGGNNIFRNTGLWFSATTNEAMLYPNTDVYPSDELFMGNQVAYEFWSGKVEKVKNDKAVNMTSMLLMNDILSQEQLVPNGKYTIAFKYKKVNILSNISVKINDVLYPLTSNDETNFVQTIDVNSQHISLQFISDTDESCEIYDLMVNVGETSLAYSQNQNETTTDSVNISKGITITSSDLDVTFKANADGIRTLDKSGNELTKFTDTGMTTKKAIIEDKSTIVGLLYQEVGNQTWITKL